MLISLNQILYAVALAFLGAGAGFGVGFALFQGHWKPRDFQGNYFGGMPILGATAALLLVPDLPLTQEIYALVGVVCGFVFLGMIRDFQKNPLYSVLPYQILLIIIGAFFNIEVAHRIRFIAVLTTILWPIAILYCLKLASLVFEMPFLLCLGSGITFLLFFPNQQSTPPWVVVYSIGLIIVSFLCLLFMIRRRGFIGDSGLFALGFLLSAVSMLGRSKSLLMFGLLVPSMVIFYPFVLISLILMSSYLGNELYLADPKNRKTSYQWTLSRTRLVVFSALIFFCLNFLELFILVNVPWYAYLALVFLFIVSVISFVRTFARRTTVAIPEYGSRIQILGVPMDVVSPSSVLKRIAEFLEAPREEFYHIVTADSLAVFRASRDKGFNRIITRASLVIPDGAGLIWAADFLGTPLPMRVPGISLVMDICQAAAQNAWPLYFLGSRPGVAQEAANILTEKYPGLKIAGVHHGFFHEGSEAEDAILDDIQKRRPRLVFVALGVPKQEIFIQKLRPLAPGIVAIGVGGSFDVISGSLPRAPIFMQRFAMEWLFRLWTEPKRLFRVMRIPWFVLAVLRAKWQDKEFVV